jgi:perosamine synthetase
MQPATLAATVVATLREVLGPGPVVLHEPCFGGRERDYVTDCIDTTFVSSVGKYVDRFEAELAGYTGAGHAVAVVNGTAALQVALQLAGVGGGDEVLMPALTFVATACAARHLGATPHFVDSEPDSLGLDARALRDYLRTIAERRAGTCVNRATGRVLRAVVPMHAFGHPVDIEALLSVASEFGLALVEDAAESLGSTVHGRHTGTFGLMGTLSFNGNKTVTTGGGGAIITSDRDLARHAKHLTTTAKVPHRWEYRHDEVGYNFRLPNINAALGCAQLEQLETFIRNKRRLFERYRLGFEPVSGVRLFTERAGTRSNYWLQSLLLDAPDRAQRDAILAATNEAGYMTRPAWTLLHELEPYRDCPRMPLPGAERIEQRLINIPSSSQLGAAERC